MRVRLAVVLLASLAAAALAGCSTSAPDPTPSTEPPASPSAAAEPTTLEELAEALADEGIADLVSLREVQGTLQVLLGWSDAATTQQQLDAYQEIGARVESLLDGPPTSMQLSIVSSTADVGSSQAFGSTFDPGESALRELLDVVHDTPCTTASLEERDEGDGAFTLLQLSCDVDADDAVALASSYDEVTALQPASEVVDRVRWQLGVVDSSPTSPTIRIDEGPVAGRQQLLVDVLTIAAQGGDALLSVVDGGDGVVVNGTADPAQTHLCDAIAAPLVAAGVRPTVQLQAAGVASPTLDDVLCRVDS